MILEGGANIYGIPIGVLSLESYFAKPPGHIKNAATFDFPVTYRLSKGPRPKKWLIKRTDPFWNPLSQRPRSWNRRGLKRLREVADFSSYFNGK